ncbi:MAG TPA: GlsB/YeaQ/YmgE family stress response membrane protein [Planctomycetota bacterium]|nr:GlsB/YeaQ/YmgE family stress response membrane protein [Planctomycetota bacterium]
MELVYFVLIGLAAGWLARTLMKTRRGTVGTNLLLGVIGAVLGGFLLRVLGFSSSGGLLPSLLVATLGAVVLLWVVDYFSRH